MHQHGMRVEWHDLIMIGVVFVDLFFADIRLALSVRMLYGINLLTR